MCTHILLAAEGADDDDVRCLLGRQVAEKRRDGSVIDKVADAFTDELVARTNVGVQATKAALWDEGGLAPLPPLI